MRSSSLPPIRFRLFAAAVLGGWFALGVAPGAVLAADKEKKAEEAKPETAEFLGVTITLAPGFYMITKDANVRAKPGTSGKKVASFDEGDKVRARGYVNAWLAVQDSDGKDLGFVYAPITIPLIDGMLSDDIRAKGKTSDGISCDYNVHFEGKSAVEGVPFETADYEVWFRCHLGAKKITFPTNMFLTEGPYQMSRQGPHQITLDVPQVAGDEYELLLSVTMLYDPDKNEVRFDGISIEDLGVKPKQGVRPAATLSRVLGAAVEIVLSSWSKKTLETISKNL